MQNNFDFQDKIEDSSGESMTNKDRLNAILGYIPFINIWMLFLDKPYQNEKNSRFVKQGITLFLLYIILFLFLSLVLFKLLFILTILYLVLVIFFGAKAYNGIYIEIEFIEKIIKNFDNTKK